jgi:hypothetical protein
MNGSAINPSGEEGEAMKGERTESGADRLRAAGYDPEAMTHAEFIEAIERGLIGVSPGAQAPRPEVSVDPARTPCPQPYAPRPCERPEPSRVSRLAPNLIAALIGLCAGVDLPPSVRERDRKGR